MTVLAIDTRGPDERAAGPDGWDPWLWLLADVQRYALDVLLFTPMMEVTDLPDRFAPERYLETCAWCNREVNVATGRHEWPPWWPYADTVFARGNSLGKIAA
jgi:hypothetical protein